MSLCRQHFHLNMFLVLQPGFVGPEQIGHRDSVFHEFSNSHHRTAAGSGCFIGTNQLDSSIVLPSSCCSLYMDASKPIYISHHHSYAGNQSLWMHEFSWIESFPSTQRDFLLGSGPYEIPWLICMQYH